MYAKIVLLEKNWKKLAKESHTVKRCVYFWWKGCVCEVFVFVCVCSAGDWWLLSMQAYICEWIGVTAHEQTQGGRLWNSLQRIAWVFTTTYTHQGGILTHLLSLTHKHTHHTYRSTSNSSAWRSTCQLPPAAEKDGLCWFCEAHRQDPPGDCRSPAAQTSALTSLPYKQSVFYTASLYHCTMHYRTAIEQEIKLGDRYLEGENKLLLSSLFICKDH